jgi:hypothetical protein
MRPLELLSHHFASFLCLCSDSETLTSRTKVGQSSLLVRRVPGAKAESASLERRSSPNRCSTDIGEVSKWQSHLDALSRQSMCGNSDHHLVHRRRYFDYQCRNVGGTS